MWFRQPRTGRKRRLPRSNGLADPRLSSIRLHRKRAHRAKEYLPAMGRRASRNESSFFPRQRHAAVAQDCARLTESTWLGRSRRWASFSLFLSLFSFLLADAVAQSPAPMNRIDLRNGWTVQTSRNVQATGDIISTSMFQTKDWYRTSVPMTVLAVQVAAGEFPEPYHGMNLRNLPGIAAYNIGETFADKPIPDDSPYAVSWWYGQSFRLR